MKKYLMKIPIVLTPQKEGGWTVTSPLIPELITEIDNLDDLIPVVKDALEAVKELYDDLKKEFPVDLLDENSEKPVWCESILEISA